jgi:chromosome segregation ATPase
MSSSERSAVADALNAGMESWSTAIDAQRRFLEQLSGQVRDAVAGGVEVSDLQQVLTALQLMEQRTAAAEDQQRQTAARLDSLDARLQELSQQVGVVARSMAVITEQIGALAAATAPPARKKAPARKAAAKKAPARKASKGGDAQ